jgi:hypothetical protein
MRRRGHAILVAIASTLVTGSAALTVPPAPTGAATTTTPAQTAQTQAWMAQITSDFSPLSSGVERLLQTFQQWSTRGTSAKDVTSAIDGELPQFSQTIQALAAQTPLPWTAPALADYQASAQIYITAVRVERVASLVPTGRFQQQLQRSELRIRELGDKVYNEAGSVLAGYLPAPATNPDVITIAPPPVPNFAKEALLPGPPLDHQGIVIPTRRIGTDSLTVAIKQVRIPSGTTETRAIRSGSLATLRALSDAFSQDSADLSTTHLLTSGTATLSGLRVGLLLASEATRAAEASRLVTAASGRGALERVAQELAVVGDHLLIPTLGSRPLGFDPAVLTATGP